LTYESTHKPRKNFSDNIAIIIKHLYSDTQRFRGAPDPNQGYH